MKAKKHFLRFINKEKIADKTYSFHFEKNKEIVFEPGQYYKVFLNISNPDERGSSRYFTVSSGPKEKYLTITTKIIQSSFKKNLEILKEFEEIEFFGPVGFFNFDRKSSKTKVFLAGGIGITPFRSILKTYLDEKQKIFLFASYSSFKDVIFYEEIKGLENRYPNFKSIFTLSKEKKIGFEKGRISNKLLEKYLKDITDKEFFVVGSIKMEEELISILKEMGIDSENIFSENFTGY